MASAVLRSLLWKWSSRVSTSLSATSISPACRSLSWSSWTDKSRVWRNRKNVVLSEIKVRNSEHLKIQFFSLTGKAGEMNFTQFKLHFLLYSSICLWKNIYSMYKIDLPTKMNEIYSYCSIFGNEWIKLNFPFVQFGNTA